MARTRRDILGVTLLALAAGGLALAALDLDPTRDPSLTERVLEALGAVGCLALAALSLIEGRADTRNRDDDHAPRGARGRRVDHGPRGRGRVR
jgi:hypothetical protein